MAHPVNQAMLLGDEHIPTDADLDLYADSAVRVFLAAYGNPARTRRAAGRRVSAR